MVFLPTFFWLQSVLLGRAIRRCAILGCAIAFLGFGACVSRPQPEPARAGGATESVPSASAPLSGIKQANGLEGSEPTMEIATLAGGCFWGMEEILRKVPGVTGVEVGYTGGTLESPKYEDTHDGASGHAESVRIEFDPKKLTYEDLLAKWFFRMHDPTTKDRQGNDRGSQYRSAIFFTSEAQRATAERVKNEINKSGRWKAPVVTEITKAGRFWSAEAHHQDYLQKKKDGYTCHYLRDWG